ncbi:hypothetical protein CWI36_0326p0020 [Hamiltosporidium magnivora]|uniref:Pyrimidine 5'-nucleotidase n=1 Tax=Hamiltosporidium magnivora TaxID=148818 RepID=A0A4Q9LGP0_9MICR|nr:hypothetical protein CWI36_0326p0020 [Hamiltosporidium magnivora]
MYTCQSKENHKNVEELVEEMNKNPFILFISTLYLENIIRKRKTVFNSYIDNTILEEREVMKKEKTIFKDYFDNIICEEKGETREEKIFFIFENEIIKYFTFLNPNYYNEWVDIFKYRIFYEIYCCFLSVFDGMEMKFNEHKFFLERMKVYVRNSGFYSVESILSCNKSIIVSENDYISEFIDITMKMNNNLPQKENNQIKTSILPNLLDKGLYDGILLEEKKNDRNLQEEKSYEEKLQDEKFQDTNLNEAESQEKDVLADNSLSKNHRNTFHMKLNDSLREMEITNLRKLIELYTGHIQYILDQLKSHAYIGSKTDQKESEICEIKCTKDFHFNYCTCKLNKKRKQVSTACNTFSSISKKTKRKESTHETLENELSNRNTDKICLKNEGNFPLYEKELLDRNTSGIFCKDKGGIPLNEKELFENKSTNRNKAINGFKNTKSTKNRIPLDIFQSIQLDLKKYFGKIFDSNEQKIKRFSFLKIYFESKLYKLYNILLRESLTEDMKKIIFKSIYFLFYKTYTEVIRNSIDNIKSLELKNFKSTNCENIYSYFEQILKMDEFLIGSEKATGFIPLNSLIILSINYNQIVLIFDLDNTLFPTDEIEKNGVSLNNTDIYSIGDSLRKYFLESNSSNDKYTGSINDPESLIMRKNDSVNKASICSIIDKNVSLDNLKMENNLSFNGTSASSIITTEESFEELKMKNEHFIDQKQLPFLKITQHIIYKERLKIFLTNLPGKKICFTNSRKHHASYILTLLNILDCFDIIVHRGDIEDTKYIKPGVQSYIFMEKLLGVPPNLIYFYDDDYINYMMAKQRKWNSFLIKDSLEQVVTESLESYNGLV